MRPKAFRVSRIAVLVLHLPRVPEPPFGVNLRLRRHQGHRFGRPNVAVCIDPDDRANACLGAMWHA